MALEQLAYEEAKRGIDRQSGSLDGLRSRAGILLAAISLSTSFFGGLALDDGGLTVWGIIAAIFATASALVAGALCVAVLWPRAAWAFNLSARDVGRQLQKVPDEATAYRELALRLEINYDANELRLERCWRPERPWRLPGLFWLFRAACIALGIETLFWVVVLAL